ncbi:MAG TPA: hypothetical protein VMZ53_01700 [Kofleriaceae bacterium]|nr:hypothetical protein [Kofleriaceae bacterium]
MKQTKFILIAAGVIGVLACFLPYIKEGSLSMSYWDFHKLPKGMAQGLLNGPQQVYVAMVGFLITAVMGVLGMKQLLRWQAIVAIVGCLVALACEGVRKGLSGDHGVSTAIGGKLLFVAAVLGIVGGIIGLAKPDKG